MPQALTPAQALLAIGVEWSPTVEDVRRWRDLAERALSAFREVCRLIREDRGEADPTFYSWLEVAQSVFAETMLFPDHLPADAGWDECGEIISQWAGSRAQSVGMVQVNDAESPWFRRHLLRTEWLGFFETIGEATVRIGPAMYPSAHAAAICSLDQAWLDWNDAISGEADDREQAAAKMRRSWGHEDLPQQIANTFSYLAHESNRAERSIADKPVQMPVMGERTEKVCDALLNLPNGSCRTAPAIVDMMREEYGMHIAEEDLRKDVLPFLKKNYGLENQHKLGYYFPEATRHKLRSLRCLNRSPSSAVEAANEPLKIHKKSG